MSGSSVHPVVRVLQICFTDPTISRLLFPNPDGKTVAAFSHPATSLSDKFWTTPLFKLFQEFGITNTFDFAKLDINSPYAGELSAGQQLFLHLFNILCWVVQFEQTHLVRDFVVVLSILQSLERCSDPPAVFAVFTVVMKAVFACDIPLHNEHLKIFNAVAFMLERFIEPDAGIMITVFDDWLGCTMRGSKLDDLGKQLLVFVALFILDHRDLFVAEISVHELVETTSKHLFKFDENCLTFFHDICPFVETDLFFQYAQRLLGELPGVVGKLTFGVFDPEKYPEAKQVELQIRPSYIPDLPSAPENRNHRILLPVVQLRKPRPFPVIDTRNISQFVRIVCRYKNNVNEFDGSLFIPSMQYLVSVHPSMDIVAMFSVILGGMKMAANPFFVSLFERPIFDPRLTIFTRGSQEESVHEVRTVIYESLIVTQIPNILSYFERFQNFPMMIAEFFYRCARLVKEIPIEVLIDDAFLMLLFTYLMSLQETHFQYHEEGSDDFQSWFSKIQSGELDETEQAFDDFQQIECARVCLFFFVGQVVQREEVAIVWHASIHFTPAMFSLMFEENGRPIVTGFFAKIWSYRGTELEKTIEMIEVVFAHQDCEPYRNIVFDLIQILVGVLEKRPDEVRFFQPFVRHVTQFLAHVEPSIEFLYTCLAFCALVAAEFTTNDCSAFLGVIEKLEGSEPSQATFNKLAKLLTSPTCEHLIARPQICEIMVKAFLQSEKLLQIFSFLGELCQKSLPTCTSGSRTPSCCSTQTASSAGCQRSSSTPGFRKSQISRRGSPTRRTSSTSSRSSSRVT
jgi:hypothetical protein